MLPSDHRKFLYHASAHAYSGHFVRPENVLIEAQAGVTLPSSGGQHTAHVENFRHGALVSFDRAASQVCGSEKIEDGKTIHTTLVTTAIEKLNILNMVTADRVVARLASSFEPGAKESKIVTVGTRFENLRVAGCHIDVKLDHEFFLKLDTFEAARNEFASNEEFRKMSADPFDPKPGPSTIGRDGIIHCTLVKELHPPKCCGVTHYGHRGHVLVVPEFGKVYLAELMLQHARKRLTMIRIELGSPQGGGSTGGEADSNGIPPSKNGGD
jgi:hypothetical protein